VHALDLCRTAGLLAQSIIHIGANTGQERHLYAASGASPCLYVEPITSVYEVLAGHLTDLPGHSAVQALCSDVDGETVDFNIASNGGQSSSMLPLGHHAVAYPFVSYVATERMVSTTLDSLLDRLGLRHVPNLMIIDTQGADLRVLQGARRTLEAVDAVFVEVSEAPLYDGGCTLDEVTGFLRQQNFRMRWMSVQADGVGDAFYVKPRAAADLPLYGGNLALNKAAAQSSASPWSRPDDAQGAVDGNRTGLYGFHTGEEHRPWWQVDLGTSRPLNELRVYNRLDTGRERSRSLQAAVSEDGTRWDLVHDQSGYTFGGIDGRPLRVKLEGRPARYVRLELAERAHLHLDEVEVY
jgi:FkbM family methyltransferase